MGLAYFVVHILSLGIILSLANHVHSLKPNIQNNLVMKAPISSRQRHLGFVRTSCDQWIQIRGGGGVKQALEEVDEEDDDMPMVAKVFSLLGDTLMTIMNILNDVINTALNASSGNDDFDSSVEEESFKDFGAYLSNAYGCVDEPDEDNSDGEEKEEGERERGEKESRVSVEGGSLTHALLKARSKARLLVVFIPASRPTKKTSYDRIALQSILSSDVTVAAERRPRKKETYGSYMFWATKSDSSEASTALKRLKVKPPKKSKKSPILVVVYPSQSIDSAGRPKIVPRVLAQHHCNPPPSPESMVAWLNSLRKRHMKQYATMHRDLREIAFMKERNEGYKSSMRQDQEREEEERRTEQKRLEEERIQKEKEEALKQRRKSLLESLPEEPSAPGDGVITIALRFGDGRAGQRRFMDDTEIDVLFNWVDALFEMEREGVLLTTMNGQASFSFGEEEGKTLKDANLGRLVALRVLEKKDRDDEDGSAEVDANTEEE